MKQSFNKDGDGASTPPANPLPPAPRHVRSEDLMAGSPELVIDHAGQAYRLRITRNGKLILTK
ncbi:MAG: hemin uptake protein HemP [Planctomycetes bacterium]|nr:hemin uptake protein HemP [Planctomycetota bacterium]